MVQSRALAACLDLPIMIKPQLVLPKAELTEDTSVMETDAEVAQSITGVRISLKPTTATGENRTIRPEAVLDRRVGELMGCIVDGEEG